MIKKINKELLILIVSRVLQIVISLLSIKIATKYLEASEMGNLYLIMSIVGFYGLFLVNPIGQYINRNTHEWYEQKKIINVFYVFNFYVLALSLFSIGITYLVYQSGVGNTIELFYFVSFVALFIYFNTWNQTIIPMINMLEGRIAFVMFTLLTQIFTLVFAVYFINNWEAKGIVWFLGQVMAFGLMSFVALVFFVKKIQGNLSIKESHNMMRVENFKTIVKFSLPLSVGILFLWMQTQSYGIIIEKFIGAEFLGYFGVGMAVALAISGAFEAIIMQYLYPMMYKSMKCESQFQTTITNILNLVIPIYFLLAIFVSIFAVYFMSILVDVKYHSSYVYLVFGIWVAFFKMSANMIANIAHAKLNTKKLIFPYVVAGILSVVGVSLATQFEYHQYLIPIALLTASFLGYITMYTRMNKLVSIDLELNHFAFVLLYSIPFLGGIFFYDYASNWQYSLGILAIFGIYFLYILYILTKRGAIIE